MRKAQLGARPTHLDAEVFQLVACFLLFSASAKGMLFKHHADRNTTLRCPRQSSDDGRLRKQVDRKIDGAGSGIDLADDRVHPIVGLHGEPHQFGWRGGEWCAGNVGSLGREGIEGRTSRQDQERTEHDQQRGVATWRHITPAPCRLAGGDGARPSGGSAHGPELARVWQWGIVRPASRGCGKSSPGPRCAPECLGSSSRNERDDRRANCAVLTVK